MSFDRQTPNDCGKRFPLDSTSSSPLVDEILSTSVRSHKSRRPGTPMENGRSHHPRRQLAPPQGSKPGASRASGDRLKCVVSAREIRSSSRQDTVGDSQRVFRKLPQNQISGKYGRHLYRLAGPFGSYRAARKIMQSQLSTSVRCASSIRSATSLAWET